MVENAYERNIKENKYDAYIQILDEIHSIRLSDNNR